MQAVTIVHTSEQELTLEWVSSVSNDMIADSVLALLCGIDSNYATIKREFPYSRLRISLSEIC
jgi:cleavage and polyadenylation specificity factor subunit 3